MSKSSNAPRNHVSEASTLAFKQAVRLTYYHTEFGIDAKDAAFFNHPKELETTKKIALLLVEYAVASLLEDSQKSQTI